MATNFFKDRQSDNSNRRKLTIIQQLGNEMIVDVERADTNVREEGTPLNASLLNDWQEKVTTAQAKSVQAENKSQQALTKSTAAETNSTSARNDATDALRKVNALITNVDISQIAGSGTPTVELINNTDGTKRFAFKNLKGVKGDKGDIGNAAGFGQVTASAENVGPSGSPYVNVNLDGPNTEKNIHFEIGVPSGVQGLKGEKGDRGETGDAAGFGSIDAIAIALPVGGSPYVNISTEGPNTAKNIHFDFGLPAGIQGERGEKGDKGDQGNVGSAAGFGQITAEATNVAPGGTPYVNIDTNGPDTGKNIHFDFGLLSGNKGERGEKGDSTFVRFSFDKTAMTEMQTDNSMFIGFYNGKTPSTNPNDYQWIQMWGANSISASAYSKLLTSDTVNPEQIYFVEGVDGDELHLSQYARDVSFDDSKSRLSATNVQDAIDKLKAREFSKSYNDLTNKPFVPTNASFTLAGLSEKSYNSLTDKPAIPTNNSFCLAELAEKSYNSLTDKPVIPTNASFTLAGLAEKSYNSLTDKPVIPQINRETIAAALGIDEYSFVKLLRLAEVVEFTDDGGITFNTYSINVQ